MSKKKKKNQATRAASVEETEKVSSSEEESSSDESSSEEREEASEAAEAADDGHHDDHADHGGDAHGHGGHDPLEEDRPQNMLIAAVTVVSCIVVIGMVVFVREFFLYSSNAELHSKVLGVQATALRELRASEQQKLNHYQWVNQKDGVVRIPVDRAIELTIASYRNPPTTPPLPIEPANQPKPEEIKPEEKKGEDAKGEEKKDEKKDEKGDKKGGDAPKELKK